MPDVQQKRKREATHQSSNDDVTTSNPQSTAEVNISEVTPVHEQPLNNPMIYRYKKRLPMRKSNGKRDIHITRTAAFRALEARTISLLDQCPLPVTLNAMGAAITKCCELALCVQARLGGRVTVDVRTGTVVVYDDYEPLVEGYPEITKTRNKSCVRIKISRTSDYV